MDFDLYQQPPTDKLAGRGKEDSQPFQDLSIVAVLELS
jgi:hypothetical protein